ncbi:filamentous hemagglutinin N-terminal domain-containing protein [Leptolyngbyaceae cyanobacterium UHCC 1019]
MAQDCQGWHQALTAIAGLGLAGLCFTALPSLAQVTPDQTLGTESSSVTPNVTVRGLPADLIQGGATRGVNLFHSFLQFNVRDGQRVYFANPVGIETILSRVTGADPSRILGTLGVNGTASLFLINPNGILFGPNARLDVAGSFLASTASSFKFPDGSEFSASNPQAPPLLTVNVPIGLQYGINHQATIANAGNLTVGKDLILAAGNLDLQGQLQSGGDLTLRALNTVKIRDSTTAPFIAAAGGKLIIQGDRAIDIFALNHPNSGLFSGGDLVLRSHSTVGGDAHYFSGSNFRIEQLDGSPGNLFSPYDPIIRASGDVNFASYTGASLHILAGGNVTITGNVDITGADTVANSLRETVTLSDGTLLNIDGTLHPTLDIRAGTTAFGVPGVTSNIAGFTPLPGTGGTGTSANITIGSIGEPGAFDISNHLVYLTNQYFPNPGLTGTIRTGGIDIDGFPGNAGAVFIDSRGSAVVGDIVARGPGIGTGNGGNVTILATNSIRSGVMLAFGLGGGTSGSIRLLSRDGAIETDILGANGEFPGNIGLTAKGSIQVTSLNAAASGVAANAGTVTLASTAGAITVLEARTTSVFGKGGDINLTAAGDITSNAMDSGSFGTGTGGNIRFISTGGNITTTDLIRTDSAIAGAGGIQLAAAGNITTDSLNAATFGNDNGGSITINSGATFASTNSSILTGTAGAGRAGNIDIQANAIALTDSIINSGTAGSGTAGDITLRGNSINLLNGAGIGAGSVGTGQGGNVSAIANNTFILSGTSATGEFSQLGTNTFGTGKAGNVAIAAGQLILRDGAVISSTTGDFRILGSPAGQGGTLTVSADVVDIRGISPDGTSPSRLATSSFGTSNAGDLTVNARQVMLQEGGILATSTFGSGRGGNLTVNAAESVSLEGSILAPTGRTPTAFSADTFGVGSAGDLTLNTRQLTVQNGAAISVSTFGTGQGGTLTVNADEQVLVQGADPDGFSSGLYAQATDQGNAGNLIVRSPDIQVRDRATITVASGSAANLKVAANTLNNITGVAVGTRPATGASGNLSIQAERLTLDNQGQILASTDSGQGGNIDLSVRDILLMRRNSLISATAGTAQAGGDGGNITINTTFLATAPFENNDIIANAFNGQGGRVSITAQGIYWFSLRSRDDLIRLLGTTDSSQLNPRRLPTNDITAISQNNPSLNGVVTLNTPDVDPSRGLSTLPVNLVDPSSRIDQKCARGSGFRRSSFVVTGRGGLAENPLEPLHSGEGLANWVEVSPTNKIEPRSQPKQTNQEMTHVAVARSPDAIVEAQGWVQEADGTIALVADTPNTTSTNAWLRSPNCVEKK